MIIITKDWISGAIYTSTDESVIPVWYSPPYGTFEVVRQEVNFSGPVPVLTIEVKQV